MSEIRNGQEDFSTVYVPVDDKIVKVDLPPITIVPESKQQLLPSYNYTIRQKDQMALYFSDAQLKLLVEERTRPYNERLSFLQAVINNKAWFDNPDDPQISFRVFVMWIGDPDLDAMIENNLSVHPERREMVIGILSPEG